MGKKPGGPSQGRCGNAWKKKVRRKGSKDWTSGPPRAERPRQRRPRREGSGEDNKRLFRKKGVAPAFCTRGAKSWAQHNMKEQGLKISGEGGNKQEVHPWKVSQPGEGVWHPKQTTGEKREGREKSSKRGIINEKEGSNC